MNGTLTSLNSASRWHLVPTTENLNLLRGVDLSSFSESQHTLNDSDNLTDDPFDSQDLVGICEASEAIATEPETKQAEVEVKKEMPSSPLFVTANSLPQGTPVRISQVTQTYRSDVQSLLLGSPQRKRLKPDLQTRSYSTNAEPPELNVENSPPKMPDLYQNRPPRRTIKDFSNPTIQLATQKPLAPWEKDLLGTQEKFAGRAKSVTPFVLSREQQYVMDLVLQGESLFFTGSAGTGKSVLLKKTIKALQEKYRSEEIAVTASTGLAAHHVGGTTVHSFSGIGLGNGTVLQLVKTVRRNRKAVHRWKYTKVLIIDEVSMIDGRLLDKLDHIAREIRKTFHLPFGGIQLVLTGDFFQLPPVSKIQYSEDGTEVKDDAHFAFESEAWKSCISSSIVLEEVFRQKGDQKFIGMLNDMRSGLVSPESELEFMRLSRPLTCPAGIVPAELYATRNEVDHANNLQLSRLQGDAYLYEAIDTGDLPPKIKAAILSNFLAPPRLHLKVGAQVMCIKNFDEGLINGSIGKVIDFLDRDVYMGHELMAEDPNYTYEEYKKRLLKKNVPIIASPQKAGASRERADLKPESEQEKVIEQEAQPKKETILDNVFDFFKDEVKTTETEKSSSHVTEENLTTSKEEDSSYVADETGVESEPSLLSPFEENKRRKLGLLERLEALSKKTKYPLVRFTNADNVTTRDVLIEPEKWDHMNEKNEVLVARTQLPLMLAWALSIHKSQGLTLSHVRVNLNRIFEYGQAYVALSRAVSRESLQVVNFRRDRIRSSLLVEEFYKTLTTASEHRKRNSVQ